MKKGILASLIAAIFIISILLSGCQSDGIAQELYDSAVEQLNNAQATIAGLQDKIESLEAAKESVEEDLQDAAAAIAELQAKVSGMAGQYDLAGATTLETVTNIIEYYHDTHVYSKTDLFVCSDMASEVWSMLQAQGIDALIVVGDKEKAISDIIQSDHAWLLAEVEPGQYLALEATAGYAVYESENPLYYQGWYFDSPADMKSYNELVKEYNVRVEIRNQMVLEDQQVVDEHNQSTNPTEAAKLKAVHDMLEELILAQEAELLSIETEIDRLATVLT
jgi:mannose/fructose-specific phosphotransferase system component IIA